MTKSTFTLALLFGVLSLPAVSCAAGNDVTLTTSAVIQVGSYTLNVTGSSAAVQSIVVTSDSFSVTLASGSSIAISSPTLNRLLSDVSSDVTGAVCTNAASSLSLSYSGAGTITNTITPSTAVCPSGSSSGTPSQSSTGGRVPIAVLESLLTPSASTTAYLKSLHQDCYDAACTPVATSAASPSASSTPSKFTREFGAGSVGPDVLALQRYLNSHDFALAASGPGSSGNETTYFGTLTWKALMEFQDSHGIKPATGYFGPKTTAYIQAHP